MWLHLAGLAACGAAAAALLASERRRRAAEAKGAACAKPNKQPKAPSTGEDPKVQKQRQRRRRREQQQQQQEQQQRTNRAALLAELGGGAAERIPSDRELAAVAALARSVHAARGWRDGRYLVTQAWARVEARAGADDGGGWPAQFEAPHVVDARLTALAAVIDAELLGGLLGSGELLRPLPGQQHQPQQRGCEAGGGGSGHNTHSGSTHSGRDGSSRGGSSRGGSRGAPPSQQQLQLQPPPPPPQQQPPQGLRYRAVHAPRETWIACFLEGDADSSPEAQQRPTVFVNTARWAEREVSRAAPINCEGVVCTSRLQLLAHSLAHEMVHAVVAAALPAIHAGSEAYREDGSHGPIFQVLNRQLFGHPSNAMARCNARAAL